VATPAHTTQTWRFGIFEVDAQTGELRRGGVPIKLREQCFRTLVLLLEHEGQVVAREELRKTLWSDDTFVDFDHGLNAAVMKLREALGDTAEKPLYIETIPKRGYRFIAPVAHTAADSNDEGTAEADRSGEPMERAGVSAVVLPRKLFLGVRLFWWAVAGWSVALVALTATVWHLRHPRPFLRIPDYAQLTSDGRLKTIEGTDGNNIYLNLWSPAGHATVPVTGGPLREFSIDLPSTKESPGENPIVLGVSPDGSALLVGSPQPASGRKLWVIGTHGSGARYLATDCRRAAWSQDGRTVVYSTRRGDIYTVPSEGGDPRLLLVWSGRNGEAGVVYDLAWSPDGRRIRFVRNGRYWEVSAAGTNAHEMLPNWHADDPKYLMWSGQWTPDGKFFLFIAASAKFSRNLSAGGQIWALDERHSWLPRPNPIPIQLTTGAIFWGGIQSENISDEGNLAISKDGAKIYSTGSTLRGELVFHNRNSKQIEPYLSGVSAEGMDFTKDGKQLVYVKYPEGEMWRANRDGTGLLQLNTSPLYPVSPRWSPDGSEILFTARSPSGSFAIYTIASQGGTPTRLMNGDAQDQVDATWSPDGKSVVFSEGLRGGLKRTRILVLATGRITDLPSTFKEVSSPRWSPDGRHIAGTTTRDTLVIFDLETNRWSVFTLGHGRYWCNWPSWSHDGRFLYFLNVDVADFHTQEPGVYRIPISGGEPEKVVDLKGFVSTGYFGFWAGLDPEDNPLLLRDAGMREIFALTLERQ
jgi:Tol biopolymer transport system component/DNA-binding winged helix-turn-helix (wHTH) protein